MKHVWFMQDNNDMRVREVFTTQKAVVAKVKWDYGKGRFNTVAKGRIYQYIKDDKDNPACYIEKVPVIRNTRI